MDESMPGSVWTRMLGRASLEDGSAEFPRFTGAPAFTEHGGLHLSLDRTWDLHLDAEGVRALDSLLDALLPTVGNKIDPYDLRLELLRYVGAVLQTSDQHADSSFDALVSRLDTLVASAVVAVPLGGVYSSAVGPLVVGPQALVGHVSRETEEDINSLALANGLDAFRFTGDAWWTEQFLSAEEDQGFAIELAEEEAESGAWQPLVLACAVPAVGSLAASIALGRARQLLGAVKLCAWQIEELAWRSFPWVLGEASRNDDSRSPMLDLNGVLDVRPLFVDSRLGGSVKARTTDDHNGFVENLDFVEILGLAGGPQLISSAVTDKGGPEVELIQRVLRWVHLATANLEETSFEILEHALSELQVRARIDRQTTEPLHGNIQALMLAIFRQSLALIAT